MANENDDRKVENEFDAAVRQDVLTNALIRIAKDLERVTIGIFASAGLLGAIVFIMVVRWMTGH